MIWIILILISGLYLTLLAMRMKVKREIDFAVFKVLPFLLGLACILYGVKEMNWI